METRKITVIVESTNSTHVIETGAETLGELKQDLQEAGIEYEGKMIREGLSRTELIDDASILPKDVPFRGLTTNNLIFTITTANKKIKSGYESFRQYLYRTIKEKGLQEGIKETFGRNYTQVSSDDLDNYLGDYIAETATGECTCGCCNCQEAVPQTGLQDEFAIDSLRGAIRQIYSLLYEVDIIDNDGLRAIKEAFPDVFRVNKLVGESPWTKSQLEEILKGM